MGGLNKKLWVVPSADLRGMRANTGFEGTLCCDLALDRLMWPCS